MANKKKLLFINPGQFGYKAGYYYYCKYLKDDFYITFICYDRELKKVTLNGLKVIYISFKGNKILRYLRWLKSVYKTIKNSDENTIIFMVYFKLCFVFSILFPKKKIILDIRTGSIKHNAIKNWLQNKQIWFESLFFKNITILSKGLIKHLGIKESKCHWLPLGAEIISDRIKNFKKLKLLYVGTFNNRRIHKTVEGLKSFIEKNKISEGNVSYDIFGFGSVEEEAVLLCSIESYQLEKIVHFHGRKNHSEVKNYFDKCNIGVSYVPITPYYEYQPPTKTFEYILSGMACIATNTYENRQLISEENGVLCDDTPIDFANKLEYLYKKKWSSITIRNSLSNYQWQNIIKNNLSIYLNKVINGK